MTITITAFEASPDRGAGQARDMRVRWALEELGLAYEVRPMSFASLKSPEHLARQPFGQIPTFEEDGLVLFESGAIVLHLASRHGGLLPDDAGARARAISWVVAALATVEPPIVERETAEYAEADRPWHAARVPLMEARIRARLDQLAARLGDGPWLEGDFSAADLVMAGVLRRLQGSALLAEQEALADYVARAEARPAFRRAFAAQLAAFEAGSAGGGA